MCTFPVIIIVFVDSFRLFFFSCGSHCWFSLNRVCVFCMCIHLFNRLRWFSLLCGCHSFFIPLFLMIVCASFFFIRLSFFSGFFSHWLLQIPSHLCLRIFSSIRKKTMIVFTKQRLSSVVFVFFSLSFYNFRRFCAVRVCVFFFFVPFDAVPWLCICKLESIITVKTP